MGDKIESRRRLRRAVQWGGLEGMYPDEKTHPATESKRKDGDNFLTSHCLAKGNM